MPEKRSRGLVFFTLIAMLAGLGGLALWQVRNRLGSGSADEVAARSGADAGSPRLIGFHVAA